MLTILCLNIIIVVKGKVEGESRGPNPMDPPKVFIDNYYWMRDDERKNPGSYFNY